MINWDALMRGGQGNMPGIVSTTPVPEAAPRPQYWHTQGGPFGGGAFLPNIQALRDGFQHLGSRLRVMNATPEWARVNPANQPAPHTPNVGVADSAGGLSYADLLGFQSTPPTQQAQVPQSTGGIEDLLKHFRGLV